MEKQANNIDVPKALEIAESVEQHSADRAGSDAFLFTDLAVNESLAPPYASSAGLAHWAIKSVILSSMRLSTVRSRRMGMPLFVRIPFFKASRAA